MEEQPSETPISARARLVRTMIAIAFWVGALVFAVMGIVHVVSWGSIPDTKQFKNALEAEGVALAIDIGISFVLLVVGFQILPPELTGKEKELRNVRKELAPLKAASDLDAELKHAKQELEGYGVD